MGYFKEVLLGMYFKFRVNKIFYKPSTIITNICRFDGAIGQVSCYSIN